MHEAFELFLKEAQAKQLKLAIVIEETLFSFSGLLIVLILPTHTDMHRQLFWPLIDKHIHTKNDSE